MSDLKKYLELPYTVILRRDHDGDFVAKVDELPGCAADGKTPEEALDNLEEAKALWIEDCLENGDPVPQPVEETLPSGKWLQRVPRTLHRKLQGLAKREGVSFNHYVSTILAEAAGMRAPARAEKDREPVHETSTALWSEHFVGHARRILDKWVLIDVTPRRFEGTNLVKGLSHLASQFPDRFEVKPKLRNESKKKHPDFEVC